MRVTAASVSSALMIYGNQLFLRGNKVELASDGLCFQIVGLILIFQNQTNRLVSRNIAETCKHKGLIIRSTVKNALFMAGGSAILALIALALMETLPGLLADPRYEAARKFIPMLCVWVIIAGAANSVVQHVLSCNEESFYLGSSIVSGICAFTLGVIFVPRYGGVAVVTILVALQFLMMVANFCKIVAIANAHRGRPTRS
jgi:O-antigen/teichoic acid export membrane protein